MKKFSLKRVFLFIAALVVFSSFSLFGDEIDDLNSRLRKAIDNNDISTAKVLLDSGVDPNGFYDKEYGVTFLMKAIDRGKNQLAALLLAHGADTEARDKDGETAVFFSSRGQGTTLLAARGARFDVINKWKSSPLKYQTRNDRESAIIIIKWEEENSPNFSAQFDSREEYLTDILAVLLSGNYTVDNDTISKTYTLVEHLLKGGANPRAKHSEGFPIACLAAGTSKLSQILIPLLVEYGAPVNDFAKYSEKTFLYCAVSAENDDLVDFLLRKGADPNIRCNYRETALMKARSEKTINSLFNYGADPNLQDEKGKTALMKVRDTALIMPLLRGGANPALKDDEGRTVLYYWVRLLDGPLLAEVVSRGCVLDEPDHEGLTPLLYAARYPSDKAVLALLEKGADPDCRDQKGRTALHLYLLKLEESDGWRHDNEWDRSPIAAALLDAGTNPAEKNDAGDSALLTVVRISQKNSRMAPLRDMVFQYTGNDEITSAQASVKEKTAKEKKAHVRNNLSDTFSALTLPLVVGGLGIMMREVVFADKKSENIMGPVNGALALGTGGFFLGLFMGVGDGGLDRLGAGFLGGIAGIVSGIIIACLPPVRHAFTNNPVLYYIPAALSLIPAGIKLVDIWW